MIAPLAVIIAAAIAAAAPGHAQPADQFDGIYDLRSTSPVSNEASSGGHQPCSLNLDARPLHIDHGHVSVVFRRRSAATGEASPAGAVILMNPEVTLELTAHVDATGVLRGYLNTFDGCGYDLVFRKRATP